MNKQSNSLGKRSTNTASLSNAISSIKSSISPVIKTGRVPGHPKPLKANNEMWIPRTVRIFLSQPAAASDATLPISSVFNNGEFTGQVRILGLKVWNYTNSMSTTNYVGVATNFNLTETSVTTEVNDVGASDHLPGVMVKIPRTIASNQAASSTNVCTIRCNPTGTAPSVAQTFCIDVACEYKTDTAN